MGVIDLSILSVLSDLGEFPILVLDDKGSVLYCASSVMSKISGEQEYSNLRVDLLEPSDSACETENPAYELTLSVAGEETVVLGPILTKVVEHVCDRACYRLVFGSETLSGEENCIGRGNKPSEQSTIESVESAASSSSDLCSVLSREISRAYRFGYFTSVAVLRIELPESTDPERCSFLLNSLKEALSPRIRLYDSIFTLDFETLALVFPHTDLSSLSLLLKTLLERVQSSNTAVTPIHPQYRALVGGCTLDPSMTRASVYLARSLMIRGAAHSLTKCQIAGDKRVSVIYAHRLNSNLA